MGISRVSRAFQTELYRSIENFIFSCSLRAANASRRCLIYPMHASSRKTKVTKTGLPCKVERSSHSNHAMIPDAPKPWYRRWIPDKSFPALAKRVLIYFSASVFVLFSWLVLSGFLHDRFWTVNNVRKENILDFTRLIGISWSAEFLMWAPAGKMCRL